MSDTMQLLEREPYHVASADGTAIAVWRTGSGPPLVLVHGTTADHTRWSRLLPRLESAFSIHALDRRGRGGSGDARAHAVAREAEDVAAVVAAAARSGRAALLGHSYGAICCLEAALLTDRIDRLILYEPPLPLGVELVPRARRDRIGRLLEGGDPEGALLMFFREVVEVPEAQLDVMRAHPVWPARVAAAHTIPRELTIEVTYRPDFERLAAVRVPTLLLLGGASPDLVAEPTRRLVRALPDARIAVIEGQQHVAMDTVPDLFTDLVLGFLAHRSGS